MPVDLVVDTLAETAGHDIGPGALAWLTKDRCLAVQTGDPVEWVPQPPARALFTEQIPVSPTLANGAAAETAIAFPEGLFAHPPVVALSVSTARYGIAVVPESLTAAGCTIRVANYSGEDSDAEVVTASVIAAERL
jgi:hypothetical protein